MHVSNIITIFYTYEINLEIVAVIVILRRYWRLDYFQNIPDCQPSYIWAKYEHFRV